MKVEQSSVVQQSTTAYSEKTEKAEKMTAWVGKRPEAAPEDSNRGRGMLIDMLDLSVSGLELSQSSMLSQSASVGKTAETPKEEDLLSQEDQLKIKLLEEMLTRLTGKNFKFKHLLLKLRGDDDSRRMLQESADRLQAAFQGGSAPRTQVQVVQRPREVRQEMAQVVSASGVQVTSGSVVKNADGSVQVMAEVAQRQNYSETTVQVQRTTAREGTVGPDGAGWGMDYRSRSEYLETETMSFASTGTVKLADGREIAFDYSVNMSRAYYESSEVSVRAGDALKDPLVINMDGMGTALTDKSMHFDIDVDGKAEDIPVLAKGSGYLVFDRNENGLMDDGSELFGTQSGRGFDDLEKLDTDKNGWIDEGDTAFKNLKIWVSDGTGGGKLVGLVSADVGAIYLGDVSTDYHMKDATNSTLGMVRNSSIYLKESGKAGSIHELDLKI